MNIDLRAKGNADWMPTVKAKDPALWKEVEEYRGDRDDVGDVGRYINTPLKGWKARLAHHQVGVDMVQEKEREIRRLKRFVYHLQDDLQDEGRLSRDGRVLGGSDDEGAGKEGEEDEDDSDVPFGHVRP